MSDEFGEVFDLTLVENTDPIKREYPALNVQASYRFGPRGTSAATTRCRSCSATSTVRTSAAAPSSTILPYPDYFDPAWTARGRSGRRSAASRARLGDL